MLKHILDMLALDSHYNQSETIEIAKGKYQLVTTWKQGFKKIKREWKIK
jgi:hypothetical protein